MGLTAGRPLLIAGGLEVRFRSVNPVGEHGWGRFDDGELF